MAELVRLQSEPIRTDELLASVRGDEDGALALFVGVVRDRNEGRRVLRLEYHAYEPMAVREMERLERKALEAHAVSRVAIVHRTGALDVGDASVAVAVSAPHRAPAIRACGEIIDALKLSVPIWKKEFFEGGEVWVEGAPDRD